MKLIQVAMLLGGAAVGVLAAANPDGVRRAENEVLNVMFTTSTVYSTMVQTVTKCGEDKTACTSSDGTAYVTSIIAVTTTVCPVTLAPTPSITNGVSIPGSSVSVPGSPSTPKGTATSGVSTPSATPTSATSVIPGYSAPIESVPGFMTIQTSTWPLPSRSSVGSLPTTVSTSAASGSASGSSPTFTVQTSTLPIQSGTPSGSTLTGPVTTSISSGSVLSSSPAFTVQTSTLPIPSGTSPGSTLTAPVSTSASTGSRSSPVTIPSFGVTYSPSASIGSSSGSASGFPLAPSSSKTSALTPVPSTRTDGVPTSTPTPSSGTPVPSVSTPSSFGYVSPYPSVPVKTSSSGRPSMATDATVISSAIKSSPTAPGSGTASSGASTPSVSVPVSSASISSHPVSGPATAPPSIPGYPAPSTYITVYNETISSGTIRYTTTRTSTATVTAYITKSMSRAKSSSASTDLEAKPTSHGTSVSYLPTGSGVPSGSANGTIISPNPTASYWPINAGQKAERAGKGSIVAILIAFAYAHLA